MSGGVVVIAEAGVNHNGDPALALKLVDAAADAGADAVKFQTFRAEALALPSAAKAPYQTRTTDDGETQFAMLKRLELSADVHRTLLDRCRARGIRFLSTPFDLESLRFLIEELKLDTIKIGSGDLTNGPLLHRAARAGANVILSTGMATLSEVADALGVLACGYLGRPPSRAALPTAFGDARESMAKKVTVLQCTTEYPAPIEEANLRAMITLRETFGLPVGFSDHTLGIAAALGAAALGARVIEKHFTLDRALPGPDHRASLEPGDLAALVRGVSEVAAALGSGAKGPTASEARNMAAARKSLIVRRAVRKGERFTEDSLDTLRPGTGVSAMEYFDWLGRTASRDYVAGEMLTP